jgi:hypothetical protein
VIFGVIAVIGQQDASVVPFYVLCDHAIVNPEVVGGRPPGGVLIAAGLIPSAAVERHVESLPERRAERPLLPPSGHAVMPPSGHPLMSRVA